MCGGAGRPPQDGISEATCAADTQNYGATHFIIGRDMAGSKSSLTGEDFYGVLLFNPPLRLGMHA